MEKYSLRAIIEIAGKPKNHIEDTMSLVIKKLKEEEGIKVIDVKVHEAAEHEGIFNVFAEAELEFDDLDTVQHFCFEYTPSSIEFLEPDEATMTMNELTAMFNDLLGRLHRVDIRLKDVNAANLILERNSHNLLKTVLFAKLKNGEATLAQLSQASGIDDEQLKPFLDKYIKEGVFRKKGEAYSL